LLVKRVSQRGVREHHLVPPLSFGFAKAREPLVSAHFAAEARDPVVVRVQVGA